MAKVWGVLTGLDIASHDKVVIADEDVRYDASSLERVLSLLDEGDIVRPQNYFEPSPWHATWDTGRTLLNRAAGGDWPGTLAVRRSLLARTQGYDGDARAFPDGLVPRRRDAGAPRGAVPARRRRRVLPIQLPRAGAQARRAAPDLAKPCQPAVLPAIAAEIAELTGERQLLGDAVHSRRNRRRARETGSGLDLIRLRRVHELISQT